jgi:hypothetical protein
MTVRVSYSREYSLWLLVLSDRQTVIPPVRLSRGSCSNVGAFAWESNEESLSR